MTTNHWETDLIPNSYPPVIMIVSGRNIIGIIIAICQQQISRCVTTLKSWKKIGSFSSTRSRVPVIAS